MQQLSVFFRLEAWVYSASTALRFRSYGVVVGVAPNPPTPTQVATRSWFPNKEAHAVQRRHSVFALAEHGPIFLCVIVCRSGEDALCAAETRMDRKIHAVRTWRHASSIRYDELLP